MKRDLRILAAGFVVLILIITASYFAFRSDERRLKQLTAESPAKILEIYVAHNRDNHAAAPRWVENVRIRYQYSVNGTVYEHTTTMNGDFGLKFKGKTEAKVCYNPDDPNDAELVEANYHCKR